MTFLLLQTFLLLLAAYFLGAFLACVAKKILRPSALGEAAVAVPAAAGVARAPVGLPQSLDIPPVIQPPPVIARPAPPPARRRSEPVQRGAFPLQPMIETGQRPPPRQVIGSVDSSRFERALFGPDPNEGVPRKPVMELCPSTRTWVTGPPGPWPPEPKPLPEPVVEPEPEQIAEAAAAPDDAASPERQPGALSRSASAAGSAVKGAGSAIAAGLGSLFKRKPAAADAEKSDEQSGNEKDETLAAASVPAHTERPADEKAPRKPSPAAAHKFDTSGGDDLQRIRAIDADTERRLKELGVAMFDTIASWTPADVNRVNEALGLIDRIDREQWIEQAQILAKGGETYYSRNRATAIRAAAKALTAPTPPPSRSTPAPVVSVTPAAVVTPTPEPEFSEPAFEEIENEPTPEEREVMEAAPPPDSVLPAQPPPSPAAAEPRSVAEMAAAAAAAIAAASASVTRGIKPIEPLSPLSKVDPNISMPAKLQDAIREKEAQAGRARRDLSIEDMQAHGDYLEEDGDDLKRIRGIGVLIEKRLTAMGITRYDHIANWTSADIDRVSQVLDFKGRIEREGWVEQARILASGGDTEFSRRVDRGDVDTSRDS